MAGRHRQQKTKEETRKRQKQTDKDRHKQTENIVGKSKEMVKLQDGQTVRRQTKIVLGFRLS